MPSFSANDPDKNNDTSSSSNTRQSQAARLTNAQFIQRRGTQSASQNLDSSSHSSTPTLVSLGNQSSRQHTPYSGSSTPQGLSRVAYASESLTKAAAKKSDSIELSRLDTATDCLEGVVYEPTGASNMFGVDSYTSLGQYPGKSRKYALKSWLRLAAAVTVVCGLGYFAVSAFRSSSLGLGRSSDATVVDPRLQSMHCDIPHPGRPLVQYVLMVDAGSTGSRIHVYKFNYCKEHPELEDEIFEQVKPGLSSFENDAGAAAHSLDSLMEAAMKGVPESLRACTPIAVKATAGLRLLGPEKSDGILKAVHDRLAKEYPFQLIANSPVEIMDGKDEGIYAWITVNYLLGTLGNAEHKTAATFDLGGGSTQIVFEPRFENWDQANGGPKMAPGEHRYEMAYGGQNYTLYQHSYLGYGLMSARKKIKELIAKEASSSGKFSIAHPCFPDGFRDEVATDDGGSRVLITGMPKGSLSSSDAQDACYKEVRKVLNKEARCTQEPCSFNGVYQPELAKTFAENPFYIFSYFYDRTFPLGVRDEFKLSDIKALTDKVCKHDVSLFASKDQQKEIGKESHFCMDLSFQYALLKDGVGMAEDRIVRSTRKIKDAETGWCLGASLALLDKDRYCKYKPQY